MLIMPYSTHISKVLKFITFISGIALFVIQIRAVWANFVMKRTAFGTSKTTMEKIPLPPITLCPEILDLDISMANTNLFLDQFYKLNDDIRVHFNHKIELDLQLGQNFDQEGKLLLMLKELWHPYMGLCYVLVPERLNFGIGNFLSIDIFLIEPKGGAVKVLLHNQENIEFVNFPDFGRQSPAFSTLEVGTSTAMEIRKSIRQYMSSTGKLQFLIIRLSTLSIVFIPVN